MPDKSYLITDAQIEELRKVLPDNDWGQTLEDMLQSLPMVEPTEYLLDGMRVKLNFNKIGNMPSLKDMEHDLQGRWVSFVGAENGKHLKASLPNQIQSDRITELEAQLADAKQVANDCRIVVDNAIAEVKKNQCQPIEKDSNGVLRFKANKLVQYLLDFSTTKGCDMNKLAIKDFSADDRMQFAQLIGYSLSGYGALSYVTDASYESACHNTPSAIQAEGKQKSITI